MQVAHAPRIVVVCAEPSGDLLASGFIKALFERYPNAKIVGIGGDLSIKQGLVSWFDMNELSVMGLVEVLKHLPRLLSIRKSLIHKITQFKPDIYIGVDAPDFNLPVAKKLKQQGIATLHYVSPTVWAWREKRIHKIKKSVDAVLGIFPFEAPLYQAYQLEYHFVGHPLADEIALHPNKDAARESIGVALHNPVLAVLPGSRRAEIESSLPIFIDCIEKCQDISGFEVIIPAVNRHRYDQILSHVQSHPLYRNGVLRVVEVPARTVMIASDFVLLTSGTATLEAMLCKRPMISAYKMSGLTYVMMKRLYKPRYFSLPNILANEALFPELLQEDIDPDYISQYIHAYFSGVEIPSDDAVETEVQGSSLAPSTPAHFAYQQEIFTELHQRLRCNASLTVANIIGQKLGLDDV